ncbi:hypothetical protein [Fluviicola sp.]|uniref:hypothetical protein n=1 Tax=Fluviicola sp. TaxID=1917219 RepID=UPI003D26B197
MNGIAKSLENRKILPADAQIIKALTSPFSMESNKASAVAEQKISAFVVKEWEWVSLAVNDNLETRLYVNWKNYL